MRATQSASRWFRPPPPWEALGESQELTQRRNYLEQALGKLNDRERRIFEARRLAEDAETLEDLAQEFGVSRERIRQIEVRAFERVHDAVQKAAKADDRDRLH